MVRAPAIKLEIVGSHPAPGSSPLFFEIVLSDSICLALHVHVHVPTLYIVHCTFMYMHANQDTHGKKKVN